MCHTCKVHLLPVELGCLIYIKWFTYIYNSVGLSVAAAAAFGDAVALLLRFQLNRDSVTSKQSNNNNMYTLICIAFVTG